MISGPVYINIVYEDTLSAVVIERLLSFAPIPVIIHRRLGGNGCGYIRNRLPDLINAARHEPFFILLDSDAEGCALRMLNSLMPEKKRHHRCLFRIAVREVESWLLADSGGLSTFLKVREQLIPGNPESLDDPKKHLVNLARRSRNRDVREGLVPDVRTSSAIGPEYNQILSGFVKNCWNVRIAATRSESLGRALKAIEAFHF